MQKNPAVQRILDETGGLLRASEVAEILKIGKQTVYRLLNENKLPYLTIGHQRRITGKSLREFLQMPPDGR